MVAYNWGKLIYMAFIPILLIDAINGWMIRSMSMSFSLPQVYKGFLLILIVTWLIRYWVTGFYIVFSYILASIIIIFFHSSSYKELSNLIIDVGFVIKLGSVLFYFLFFISFFYRIYDIRWALSWYWAIFSFSYVVIAINILLGALGFGFVVASFGDEGYGNLGFFKAGNDVATTFLVISGVLMYKIWDMNRTWSYLIFGCLTLTLALLLQTKTVIAGIGILFCSIPIVSSGIWTSHGVLQKKTIFLFLVGGGVFALVINWIIQSELGIVHRFLYYYDRSGLAFALLMGRTYFLELAIQVLETKASVIDVLFGMGWDSYLYEMNYLYGKDKLVEIDYVDIFMINGVFGLAIVLIVWVYFLIKAWKITKVHTIGRLVLFMDLLLLGIAGTAGHILYSGMNTPFIALLNALPWLLIRNKTQQHNSLANRK